MAKWFVVITNEDGCKLELPLNSYYMTKKDADDVAKKALTVKGIVKAEVVKGATK